MGSRSLERATAFAADFGAPHAAGSYAAALEGPRVDAVYIATPHTSHRALTLLCLERGIPVLCEKPMGLNLKEVEEMVAAARGSKVYLMEALWSCFIPSIVDMKALVEAGGIGKLESVRADFGFRGQPKEDFSRDRMYNPALGGGALLDIGIYPVWLAQYLFGAPDTIHATARLTDLGADVDTQVTLRYADGRLAHAYSTILGETKTEALLLGTDGELHLHGRFHHAQGFSVLRGAEAPPENHYRAHEGNGYQFEAAAVMADVRAGKLESPVWSLDDSLLLHRTLTEIRRQIGVTYPGE